MAFSLGVKDNSGNCKTADEYKQDFSVLSSHSKIVRTYAVSDCNTLENLGPAAEEAGFQVMFGIWPTDEAHFGAEKEALKTFLPKISKSTVKVFTVGSEALYRDDMSASDLANAINEVKQLLSEIKDKNGESYKDVQVGTADSWNVLVDGGSLPAIKAADFVFANAFSYWQGQTRENASYSFVDDIMQALQTIQTAKGSTDLGNFGLVRLDGQHKERISRPVSLAWRMPRTTGRKPFVPFVHGELMFAFLKLLMKHGNQIHLALVMLRNIGVFGRKTILSNIHCLVSFDTC